MACSIKLTVNQRIALDDELRWSEFRKQLKSYYQGRGNAPDISLLYDFILSEVIPEYFPDKFEPQDLLDFLDDVTNGGALRGAIANMINEVVPYNTTGVPDVEYTSPRYDIYNGLYAAALTKVDSQEKYLAEEAKAEELVGSTVEGIIPTQEALFKRVYANKEAYTQNRFRSSALTLDMFHAKFVNDFFIKAVYVDTDKRKIVSQTQVPGQLSEIDTNLKAKRMDLLADLITRLNIKEDVNGKAVPVKMDESLLVPERFEQVLVMIEQAVMRPIYNKDVYNLEEDGVLFELSNRYKNSVDSKTSEELGAIVNNYIDYVIVADYDKILQYYFPNSISVNTKVAPFDKSLRKYNLSDATSLDAMNVNWEEKIQNGVEATAELYKMIIDSTPALNFITGLPMKENLYPTLVSETFSKYFSEIDFQNLVPSIKSLIMEGLENDTNSFTTKNVFYTLYKKFFEEEGDVITLNRNNIEFNSKNRKVTSLLATIKQDSGNVNHPLMLLITKPLEEISKVFYAEALETRNGRPSIVYASTNSNTVTKALIIRKIQNAINRDEETLNDIIQSFDIRGGTNTGVDGDFYFKYEGETYHLTSKASKYSADAVIALTEAVLQLNLTSDTPSPDKEFYEELKAITRNNEKLPNTFIQFIREAVKTMLAKHTLYNPKIQKILTEDRGVKDTKNKIIDEMIRNKDVALSFREPASSTLGLYTPAAHDMYDLITSSNNRYSGNRVKSTVTTLQGTTVAGFSLYNYFLGYKNNLAKNRQQNNSVAGGAASRNVLRTNPFFNDSNLLNTFFVRGAIKIKDQIKSNSNHSVLETLVYNINLGYFGVIDKALTENKPVAPLFDPTTYSDKTTNFLASVNNTYASPTRSSITLFTDSNGKAVNEDVTLKLAFESNAGYYRAYANNIVDTWTAIYTAMQEDTGTNVGMIFADVDTLSEKLIVLNDINSNLWNKEGYPFGLKGYAAARYYADKAGVHLTEQIHYQNKNSLITKPALIEYVSLFDKGNNSVAFKARLDKIMIQSANDLIAAGFEFQGDAIRAIHKMYPKLAAVFQDRAGERIYLKSRGNTGKITNISEINPAYRKYFYDWNFVSESLLNSSLGSIYAHKGGNENAMWLTMTKRNVAAGASMRRYTLGLENGVEDFTRTAFVDDIESILKTIHGAESEVVDLDGAALCTYTQRIKTWNSLNSHFSGDGGLDHKPFTTHFDPKTGEVGINKFADFVMSNSLIRASIGSDIDLMELHKELYSTDISKVNITNSWRENVNLTDFTDVYTWDRMYNYQTKTTGTIFQLNSIKFAGPGLDGINQYKVKRTNMTTGEVTEVITPIATMFDLWQVLGGIDSVDITDEKTATYFQELGTGRTVYVKESHTSAHKLLDYESYIGNKGEYILPEFYIPSRNDADNAIYAEYKKVFKTDGVVNTHLQLIIDVIAGNIPTQEVLNNLAIQTDPITLATFVKVNRAKLRDFMNYIIKDENNPENMFKWVTKKYQPFKGKNIDRITTAGAQKVGRFNMNDASTYSKSRRKETVKSLAVASDAITYIPYIESENERKHNNAKADKQAEQKANPAANTDNSALGKLFGSSHESLEQFGVGEDPNNPMPEGYTSLGDRRIKADKYSILNKEKEHVGHAIVILLGDKVVIRPTIYNQFVRQGYATEFYKKFALENEVNIVQDIDGLSLEGNALWNSFGKKRLVSVDNQGFYTVRNDQFLPKIPGVTSLMTHQINNMNSGVQLSAYHETEGSSVTLPTQMFNAFAFKANSLNDVNEIYNAIADIVEEGLTDTFFEGSEGGKETHNIPELVRQLSGDSGNVQQAKDTLLRIFKEVMARKVQNDEDFTLEQLIIETFTHEELPIDDPHMFSSAIAELTNYFTKRGIKISFDGMFAILSPGSGMHQFTDVKGGYLPIKNGNRLSFKAITTTTPLNSEDYKNWKAFNQYVVSTGDTSHLPEVDPLEAIALSSDIEEGSPRDLKGQQVILTHEDGTRIELSILRAGETHLIPEAEALTDIKARVDKFKGLISRPDYQILTPSQKLDELTTYLNDFKKEVSEFINTDERARYFYSRFVARIQENIDMSGVTDQFDFFYDNLSNSKSARDIKMNEQLEAGDDRGLTLSQEYEYLDRLSVIGKIFTYELQGFMQEAATGVLPESLLNNSLYKGPKLDDSFKLEVSRGEVVAPIVTKTAFLLREGDNFSDITKDFFVQRILETSSRENNGADHMLMSNKGRAIYFHDGAAPVGVTQSKRVIERDGRRYFTIGNDVEGFAIPKNMSIIDIQGDIHVFLNNKHTAAENVITKTLTTMFRSEGERFGELTHFKKDDQSRLEDELERRAKAEERAEQMWNSWQEYMNIIGTRIPGQHFQSFQGLRIVGFTSTNNIYVPNEVTLLSGSDFDIDKQNVIYYSINDSGLIEGWHPSFNWSSAEQLQQSLQLPLPGKKTFEDFASEIDVTGRALEKVIGINPNVSLNDLESLLYVYQELKAGLKLHPIQHKEIIDQLVILDSGSPIVEMEGELVAGRIRKTTLNGIKNFAISRANNIIESPLNFLLLYKPVSMDTPKMFGDNSQKGAASKLRVRENPVSITEAKYDNMVGKKVIGIMAAGGLKSLSALTVTYNNSLRELSNNLYKLRQLNASLEATDSLKDPGIANQLKTAIAAVNNDISFIRSGLLGKVSIPNVKYDNLDPDIGEYINLYPQGNALNDKLPKLSNMATPEQVNSLRESALRVLSLRSEFDDDAAELLSELLSAATDNAKELILAKINATPELAGIYASMIVSNKPFEQIVDIMTSPVVELIINNASRNVFNPNTRLNSLKNLIGLLTTIKNNKAYRSANIEKLRTNYNLSISAGSVRSDDSTAKESGSLADLQVTDSNGIEYSLSSLMSLQSMFDVADDLRLLSKYLGINQGIKSNSWELYNFKVTIQDYVNKKLETNAFDFKRFLDSLENNEQYHKDMIMRLSNRLSYADGTIGAAQGRVSSNFNILYVLASTPNFAKQLIAYNAANTVLNLSSYKINTVYNVVEKLRAINFLKPTQNINEIQYREIEKFIDNTVVDNFMQSESDIIYENEEAARRSKPVFYDGDRPLGLVTKDQRLEFANWVTQKFLPRIQEQCKNNEFVQQLLVDDKADILMNAKFRFVHLTMDTTNAKSLQQKANRDSYLYNLGLLYHNHDTDLQYGRGGPEDTSKQNNIFNVLFWYNLLINKNNITKNSYAKLLGELMLRSSGTNPYKRFLNLKGKLGKAEDVELSGEINLITSNGVQFDLWDLFANYEVVNATLDTSGATDEDWERRSMLEESLAADSAEDTDGAPIEEAEVDGNDITDVGDIHEGDTDLDDFAEVEEDGAIKKPKLTVVRTRKVGTDGTITRVYIGDPRKTVAVYDNSASRAAPYMTIPHSSRNRSKYMSVSNKLGVDLGLSVNETDAVNYQRFMLMSVHQLLSNLGGDVEVMILKEGQEAVTFDPNETYGCL